MTLERWRPGRGISPFRPFRDLEDFFSQPLWGFPMEEKGWMPAIDIFERDGNIVVKAELPGMKEDDIDISVSDHTLAIKGEKKSENEVKEEDYYRSERSYGAFYRSIPLPPEADTNKIVANFEDGVLEVTVPKTAEAKPKKIQVKATAKKKSTKK